MSITVIKFRLPASFGGFPPPWGLPCHISWYKYSEWGPGSAPRLCCNGNRNEIWQDLDTRKTFCIKDNLGLSFKSCWFLSQFMIHNEMNAPGNPVLMFDNKPDVSSPLHLKGKRMMSENDPRNSKRVTTSTISLKCSPDVSSSFPVLFPATALCSSLLSASNSIDLIKFELFVAFPFGVKPRTFWLWGDLS